MIDSGAWKFIYELKDRIQKRTKTACVCAQDTFQVDYVVMDAGSGVFDNNGGADYALPLVGASTEQQVLQRRAAAQEAAERERLAVRGYFI